MDYSLIGAKYNMLTVIDIIDNSTIKCRCDCGNEKILRYTDLKNGHIKSCGCLKTINKKREDLLGKRFGKLVVIKRENDRVNLKTKYRESYWRCRCDCGNEVVVRHTNLKKGHTKSCGCLLFEEKERMDLTGKRFGKLVVLEESKSNKLKVVCKCDCGNVKDFFKKNIINGHTKSCGCINIKYKESIIGKKFGKLTVIGISKIDMRKVICQCDCGNVKEFFKSNLLKENGTDNCGCETINKLSKINTTHGGSKTKLYKVYNAMKGRCYRLNDKGYDNYGGKGIKICDEWLGDHGFENFRDWANSNGYIEASRGEYTIERKDFTKDYCPENCTFKPSNLQAINRSNNKFIIFDGSYHTISEVSRAIGINQGTLSSRLRKGIPIEQAIIPPDGVLRNAIYFINDDGQIIAGADDPSTIDYNNYIPKLNDDED